MFSIAKVLVVTLYFCNPVRSFTNYSPDNDGFNSDYWNYFYEEYNYTYDYGDLKQLFIMSIPYFEQAVQMCPTVTFCTLKQGAGGNNQEVNHTKEETVYESILSASFLSPMSNESVLDMITTPSYLTGTWFSFGVNASTNSYVTTIPTTGTSSKLKLFLPPSSKLSNDESVHGPCCRPCSCSPNCSMTNTCCIDAPPEYYYSAFLNNCRSAYKEISQQRSNVNWPELDYLITEYSGENCLEDFFDPRNSTFDDLVLVSTKENIYKNKRHAECNGETGVKSWDLIATDCVDDLYSLSLDGSALVEYVIENCIVYSIPPDDVDPEPFVCHQSKNIIFSCNETRLWDFNDTTLLDLCHLSDHSYAYDEDFIIYANIFCLMCNKPLGYTMPQTCGIKRRFTIPIRGPAYKLLSEGGLNETMWDDTEVGKGANCNDSMVFDDHLKKCRELFCPFQGFPTNGHCSTQRPFVAINRIFEIGFRLQLSKNMSLVDIKQVRIWFRVNFFEALGFRGVCDIITVSFSAVSGEDEVYARSIIASIQLKSSQSCDEELTNQLFPNDDVSQRNILLQTGRTILNVTVEPLHPQQIINYSSRNMRPLYRQGNECSDCYIANPGSLLCPYFILNKSEYCSLYKKLSAAPKAVCSKVPFDDRILLANDSHIGSDVYYVCAHDYKFLKVIENQEKYEYDSGASNMPPTFWIVILFFCLLSF